MGRLYYNKGYEYNLDDDSHTAEIIKGHIGRCRSYRIPDHLLVDGIRYMVDSVGIGAYNSPRTLKHLIIPDSITYLDEDCLFNLPNLRSVHIGNGLRYIRNWHFRCCPKLRNITVNGSNPYMKKTGNLVISADGKLLMTSLLNCRQYIIPEGVEEIESIAFWYNTKLKNIVFPGSLRTIGDNSFSSLSEIEEIRLPEGVQLCICQSFMDCRKLKIIDFPSTLESVGWQTLAGCHNLETIILRSGLLVNMAYSTDNFESVDIERCTLYVPQHLVHAYRTHPQWGIFRNIMQIDAI